MSAEFEHCPECGSPQFECQSYFDRQDKLVRSEKCKEIEVVNITCVRDSLAEYLSGLGYDATWQFGNTIISPKYRTGHAV